MIDFAKLYCDLHPNEIITNFCHKETCLVGLCATCICSHTQSHINNKTSPEYQNIRTTYSSMHDLIRLNISNLDQQKTRIDKLSEFIHTKRNSVKANIQQIKNQTINALQLFFENREKQLLREMESEEKKVGLHSQIRLESLMNSLIRQSSSLITAAQELNSQTFLESYKRVKSQTIPNSLKLQSEISKELDKNQDFETIINSSNDHIQKMLKFLDQSIQLSYKMINRSESKQSTLKTIPSAINFINQLTSRFNHRFEQNLFNDLNNKSPTFIGRKINSHLTFNQKNQFTSKQFTAPEQFQREICRSVPQTEDNRINRPSSVKSIESEESKREMKKSTPIQRFYQSQIFRERQTNLAQQSLLQNNFTNMSKNYQSQIIVSDKGPRNSSSTMTIYMNQPTRKSTNQNFNPSISFDPQSQIRILKKLPSEVSYRPHVSKSQSKLSTMLPIRSSNYFVPQNFDQVYLNKELRMNENIQANNTTNEIKKVKKSGLTIMKSNLNGI